MPFTHDVCHGQQYESNGQKKTKWTKVGAVFTNDKGGLSLKLDFVPTSVDPVKGLWLSIFTPKPKDGQQEQPAESYDQGGVPF